MENNQELEKETKKNPTEGMVGIRQTLRDMGFSDSDIGYQQRTNTVTLKGQAFMTPTYLDEEAGVSYASASDIQKNLVKYYQNTDNPLVRVSDAYAGAAGKYGLSADALTYGNGTVSVGGTPLDVLYIDEEGKAWARQNTVNDAVAEYVKQTGVETPNDLAALYRKKYLSDAESLLTELSNQEAFSYDPDSDPVYQAYESKYLREGERAGREAIANMAALTGGYAGSAAVTAGAQAQQYYAKQLSDMIPALAEQAFDRYMEKYQSTLDLAGQMIDLYDVAYKNADSANTTQRENMNLTTQSNRERDQLAWEKNWEDIQNRQEYEINESEHLWDGILNGLKAEGQALSNQEQEIFLAYYEQLLQGDVNQINLQNQEAETFLTYYGQMLDEDVQGKQLENQEARIFLNYYEEILKAELLNKQLSNTYFLY